MFISAFMIVHIRKEKKSFPLNQWYLFNIESNIICIEIYSIFYLRYSLIDDNFDSGSLQIKIKQLNITIGIIILIR